VELHGNLAQNARTRNLDDFHAGRATVLVATDIAARGIHVDDVRLVIHADPPADHKAYLHRSGRTARAGNAGTVITLMTTDQIREVEALTRAAGITATTTRVGNVQAPTRSMPSVSTGSETPAEPRSAQEPHRARRSGRRPAAATTAAAPARTNHSAASFSSGRR
jgi:superfamily II DNA/RNA helicase